jgi:hypothetical protein
MQQQWKCLPVARMCARARAQEWYTWELVVPRTVRAPRARSPISSSPSSSSVSGCAWADKPLVQGGVWGLCLRLCWASRPARPDGRYARAFSMPRHSRVLGGSESLCLMPCCHCTQPSDSDYRLPKRSRVVEAKFKAQRHIRMSVRPARSLRLWQCCHCVRDPSRDTASPTLPRPTPSTSPAVHPARRAGIRICSKIACML